MRPLSFCVYPRVYLALRESQQSRTYSVREEERRSSCTTAIAIVHWSVQAESDLQSLQVDMKQISSTFSVFSKNRSNFYMYQVNSLGKSQWFPFYLSIILRKGCDVNSTHLTFAQRWLLGYLSVLWDKLILLHSGKHRHHAKSCLSFFFFCILEKNRTITHWLLHSPLPRFQLLESSSALESISNMMFTFAV